MKKLTTLIAAAALFAFAGGAGAQTLDELGDVARLRGEASQAEEILRRSLEIQSGLEKIPVGGLNRCFRIG